MDFDFLTRTSPSSDGELNRREIKFDASTCLQSVNGGIIAATLLRSVCDVMATSEPREISVQFIRPVFPRTGTVLATPVVHTRGADLFQADLTQKGILAARAQVWLATRSSLAIETVAQMPQVPSPDSIPEQSGRALPFWRLFEQRSVEAKYMRSAADMQMPFLHWIRFRQPFELTSSGLRAAVTLPVIDVFGFPAAMKAYGEPVSDSLALTFSLNAKFYDMATLESWMLSEAYAESFHNGVVSIRVRVWSDRGHVVAHGHTQMVLRSRKSYA